MAADTRRLIELGMVPPLAQEVAAQIDAAVSGAGLTPVVEAVETPAAYSEVAADLSAALVAAGLMEPDA